MSAQPLDARSFPLDGMRLIEASAGTGKTYTIANLYLRLVLGAGRECPLSVDQILVVTFTTAATEELRERVRRRIVTALEDFEAGASADDFIAGLMLQLPDARAACARLDAARRQMDEAAIYTIHGFCHRALADNAFESGLGFDLDMVLDETVLLQQGAEDFWRRQIAGLDADSFELLPAQWQSPDAVLKKITPFLGKHNLVFEPEPQWQPDEVAALRASVDRLKQLWLEHGVSKLLQDTPFKGRARPGNVGRIQAMDNFCRSTALIFDSGKKESFELWAPAQIAKAMPKGKPAPRHPAFELCEQLAADLDRARESLPIYLLRQGIEQIGASMAVAKQELGQLSADDLLTHLGQALDRPGSGERLAQLLADRFPVVMVDEFQDTDGLQYHIFNAIYRRRRDCGWIMIGDPKQAIYKFRGADVFTYIHARRQVAGLPNGLFSLDTNWRSSSAMVDGVNRLFEIAEQQWPEQGAFLYPGDIPFHPVQASATADERKLLIAGRSPPPLTFMVCRADNDKGQLSSARARELLAQKTAAEVVALLNGATDGEVELGGRPLAPGDIAILVRERREATEVKAALAERGVNSVFLSRASVFDAPVAQELYHLLQAVIQPSDERKLRSALATTLLGVSLPDIARLEHDLVALQGVLDEFDGYHRQYLRHGVLSMLRQLMAHRNIPARLLAQADGQRTLTDLRHLGELLQQASDASSGMHELLHWYLRHLSGERREDSDKLRVRLESDSQLVQIVTIHSSKGLEFDVVLLPLASIARKNSECIYHRQTDQGFDTIADLAAGEDAVKQTDYERLAEDLRLLYVALTRARYKCYLGLANIKSAGSVLPSGDSAIAHLLGLPRGALHENQLLEGLHATAATLGTEVLTLDIFDSLSLAVPTRVRWPSAVEAEPARPIAPRLARDPWHLTSYSALARGASVAAEVLGGANDEREATAAVVATVTADAERSAFSFPRGASYGTLLHNILEHIAFDSDVAGIEPVVRRELENFGLSSGEWSAVVTAWLHSLLAQALPPRDSLSLKRLTGNSRVSEMEFNFSLGNTVRAAQLDQLLREYGYLGDAPPLAFADITGVMRGFIDLVFEHQDCFYLLDYKSNYLGPGVNYYDHAAMARSIIEHQYDLQYLIYCLALHRYLGLRLPDYHYGQHFGGVYYLFLRGMGQGGDAGRGVFYDLPPQRLIEALDACFGGGDEL